VDPKRRSDELIVAASLDLVDRAAGR